ncbi:bifunctional riboflavin kinase/FAD synthetase [Wigglesworthia glossinidia endosymbiont of Glossina morsitans morsitans (Yale colony)]|uniref:Riboflavin biosynthesis protein n=1 Tax=Wigglesworthia glossinidia endosymbiont of Glossina morsitans morsitans (Yale colony) TaxID=1142511 RepID=H6Q522_WIGGL|nr:bifunctional riboflavin kinase/FAD synthetase [Wigglesworthia glossinidia]AFA41305.1 bifunctional riboflavin kinase/FAD synthetase [Wigglesworthia glossinidia endosymbiont of Glossina morsitans morsitans (Yale colony)]
MKIRHARKISTIKQYHDKSIITIGNFDGVHLGHQKIIKQLKLESIKRNLSMILLVFEPQPKEYLSKFAPKRITILRDKIKYFKHLGITQVICINFNKYFAKLHAEYFIKEFLVRILNTKCIVIGENFRFGYKAQGDIDLLKLQGKKLGFDVIIVATSKIYHQRISSTKIRKALKKNDLQYAENMLGHTYCISGKVIHGNAIGRTIGIPTINISLKNKKLAVNGVYAVELNGINKNVVHGVANIGIRPTFSGIKQNIEVHLLNIDGNFYSKHVEIIIKKKIREENQFASLSKLKKQILADIKNVNNYFINKNI